MENYFHIRGGWKGTVEYLMPGRNHLQIFKDTAALWFKYMAFKKLYYLPRIILFKPNKFLLDCIYLRVP